ncbi:MAG: bifunctional diguanylate cyclase/phosphodiesterase [Trueperaceae bacterium]
MTVTALSAGRRLAQWQGGLFILVCALSIGLMATLVQAVRNVSATIDSYESSGYVVTTLANLQREALRLHLEVDDLLAGRSDDSAGLELQRQLLQQQLNILTPQMIAAEAGGTGSDGGIGSVTEQLASVDRLLAIMPPVFSGSTDLEREQDLTDGLRGLERSIKQLYDREESSFFTEMGEELRSQQSLQRLVLALAAMVPLFTVSLILSLRHTFGNRFKAAYRQLDREMRERRKIEQFEQDRGRVLELVMQDAPVSQILEEIRDSLTHQRPTSSPTILIRAEAGLVHGAGARLPEALERRLGADGLDSGQATFTGLPNDIDGEQWLMRSDDDSCIRFGHDGATYLAAPIASNGDTGPAFGFVVLDRPGFDPGVDGDEGRLLSRVGQLAGLALEHKLLAEQLAHRALHDPLTDLGNSRLLQLNLERAIDLAGREHNSLALIFIDLDRFKWINDSQGHEAGDKLLVQVAERLRECVGTGNEISRLGGDEFVLVIPRAQRIAGIAELAAELNRSLAEPFTLGGNEYCISASIGISIFPGDGSSAEALLRSADYAMYEAKKRGKNGFVFASQTDERQIAQSVALESALRNALEHDEFHLVFQPYFHAESSHPAGVEALLRWQHHEFGLVPPGTFIPIAERAGLIVEIGRWVLRQACLQAARHLHPGLRVAVNVSAVQFLQSGFLDDVNAALVTSGLAANMLELELTESVLMEDLELAEQRLSALRELGVAVAIDDFGTGYSSLFYLHRLPIDTLKIDRFFIQEIETAGRTSKHARTLVETIVHMAHGLGLEVVAEGVETTSQLALVRKAGCDRVQGHLLGGASPLAELSLERPAALIH